MNDDNTSRNKAVTMLRGREPEAGGEAVRRRAAAPGPRPAIVSVPRPANAPVRAGVGAVGAALVCWLGLVACSGSPGPAPVSEGGGESEAEQTVATGVNATVIVAKCPDVKRVKVRTAQDAIQKLVGPCATVPGGRAHFSATLMPGGRIELASPEGDKAEGVVPTCVLQNRLVHKVLLRSPCTLDVQLDERTVVVERPPPDVDAGADGG